MGIQSISIEGSLLTNELFGGNVLANRNGLFDDGGYAEAIEDLNVSDLRYPGGSLTEYYFDISNPNSSYGTHSETGEVKSMIPLSDFLDYASENDHSVTIVLPTRHYIDSSSDENGDRFALVDEAELRSFVGDLASGKYGDATISALEIGNEYWHSGDMTSVEYGRVAAKMMEIIDDEIERVALTHPDAAHIDLIVQMGYNSGTADFEDRYDVLSTEQAIAEIEFDYNLQLDGDALYSGGDINYYNIANELIIHELKELDVFEAVDGVVSHVYSWGPDVELSRSYLLNQIDKTWLEENDQLETYVTEWNVRGFSDGLDEHEDYGLYQASEMLEMIEAFAQHGVDQANVWPLIQRTDNALSPSNTYDGTNVPGALFKMMSENLPGKMLLDFDPNSRAGTEADFDGFSVHGFVDTQDLVLYLTTTHRNGVVDTNLNINEIVLGWDSVDISVLGVTDGDAPGSNESTPEVEAVDPADLTETGFLDLPLDPGEIVQVIVRGYVPTPELSSTINAVWPDEPLDNVPDPIDDPIEDPGLPVVPIDEDFEDEADDLDDVGEDFGLGWLLALIPLAAIVGMFGA